MALLAHCVSYGVNALVEDRYGGAGLCQHSLGRSIAQADWLARADWRYSLCIAEWH
ncbi:hypothetical protein ACQR16_03575 [Bradyrhizobium oligotrophicum]|uniref:hypothetical protein n=1 Tax=Bradyrhizobium oligotrophicum TaxID=44255 RepID=UPI003EBEDD82